MNGAVGGCHFGLSAPRPGPTQQIVGANAEMPQAKQLTGWVDSPPISRQPS